MVFSTGNIFYFSLCVAAQIIVAIDHGRFIFQQQHFTADKHNDVSQQQEIVDTKTSTAEYSRRLSHYGSVDDHATGSSLRRRRTLKSRQVVVTVLDDKIESNAVPLLNETLTNNGFNITYLKNETTNYTTDADVLIIANISSNFSEGSNSTNNTPANPENVVEGSIPPSESVDKDNDEPEPDVGTNNTTQNPDDIQDAENPGGGAGAENSAFKISILIIVAISAAAGVTIGVVTAVVYGKRKRNRRSPSSGSNVRSKPRSGRYSRSSDLDDASESVGGHSRSSDISQSENHRNIGSSIMRSSSGGALDSQLSSQRFHVVSSQQSSSRNGSSFHGSEASGGSSMPEAYVKGKRSGRSGRPDSYVDGRRRSSRGSATSSVDLDQDGRVIDRDSP